MPSYAIYTRQSVVHDGDALSSSDAQFQICRALLEPRHASGWGWIGERFDDEGFSGKDANRPAYQRLCQRVENGDLAAVVVYSLDRLARSLLDCVGFLQVLRHRQVELIVAQSPNLGQSASDTFTLNLLASMAEFERDMIMSRLADNRASQKRSMLRIAGAVPYGYLADPQTKQLVVEPAEAQRVEAIFAMAVDGLTRRGRSAVTAQTFLKFFLQLPQRTQRTRREEGENSNLASVLSVFSVVYSIPLE